MCLTGPLWDCLLHNNIFNRLHLLIAEWPFIGNWHVWETACPIWTSQVHIKLNLSCSLLNVQSLCLTVRFEFNSTGFLFLDQIWCGAGSPGREECHQHIYEHCEIRSTQFHRQRDHRPERDLKRSTRSVRRRCLGNEQKRIGCWMRSISNHFFTTASRHTVRLRTDGWASLASSWKMSCRLASSSAGITVCQRTARRISTWTLRRPSLSDRETSPLTSPESF